MKKERNHSGTRKHRLGLAAFGLPILLTLVVMLIMGQYPFGDKTLLIWDMDWQYSSFFAHLHDILHGDASPWYSFSRAIGGDMIGVSAYYLISPFNLLFYFFDAEHIYAGITLVLLLKIGTIGWAMFTYLYHRRQAADTLIFSTAYALSGYVAGYFFNIMWLDGIILLPLMVLGIESLVEKRRWFLYAFAIALGVVTNFYIGYMLCVFSVMYFVCCFFFFSEKRKSIKTLLLYVVSSLLGGGLSACVALPAVYSMQGGKSVIDLKILKDDTRLFDYSDLMQKSFMGMTEELQMTSGMPLIYCGVFALLLVPVYYLAKDISWKKKLGYLFLQAALLVSLGLYGLCAAWQAFNMPNGSPYRFSFLYIFVVLLMAEEAYGKLMDRSVSVIGEESLAGHVTVWTKIRKWAGRYLDRKRGAMLAAGLASAFYLGFTGEDLILNGRTWLLAANLVLIAAYILIVLAVSDRSIQNGLVLAFVSLELCANAVTLYYYSPLYTNTTVSAYEEYVENVNSLVDEIREEDELFRTVLTGDAYRTVNDSMLFNLYGLDSYTSVERNSTQQVAFQLGYYTNMIFGIHYKDGSTQAAESFLGVKYLVTSEGPQRGYELVEENDSLGLYQNLNALPVAMLAEDSIFAVSNEDYNTFEYQNALYSALCSEMEEKIFLPLQLESGTMHNCKRNEDGTYSLIDPEEEGYVEYRFVVEEEGNYYLQHISADASRVVALKAENVMDLSEQGNVVKRLGYLEPGEEILIWCFIGGDGPRSLDKIYVYHEDADVLAEYAKSINAQQIEVTHEREDRITVLCNNNETRRRYLLLTIPYDRGWTVKVDGMEVTPYVAVENLMMVGVEPGEHVIELSFVPLGLQEGFAITGAAGAVLLVSYMIILIMRRKRHCNEKKNNSSDRSAKNQL